MDCVTVQSQLSNYLDAELDVSTRKAINDHLLTCDSCRKELAELRSLRAAVRSQAQNKLNVDPEHFAQALKIRIQSEGLREHRPVTNFYGRIAVVILALVIVILLMGFAQYVSYISSFRPLKASLAEQESNQEYPAASFRYPVSVEYQPLYSYPIKHESASAWLSEVITGYSKGRFTYDLLYPILEQSDVLDSASIAYKFQEFSVASPRPSPTLLLRRKLPQRFILKFPRAVLLKTWDKLYTGIKSDYRGFADAPIITKAGLTSTEVDYVYILFFVP